MSLEKLVRVELFLLVGHYPGHLEEEPRLGRGLRLLGLLAVVGVVVAGGVEHAVAVVGGPGRPGSVAEGEHVEGGGGDGGMQHHGGRVGAGGGGGSVRSRKKTVARAVGKLLCPLAPFAPHARCVASHPRSCASSKALYMHVYMGQTPYMRNYNNSEDRSLAITVTVTGPTDPGEREFPSKCLPRKLFHTATPLSLSLSCCRSRSGGGRGGVGGLRGGCCRGLPCVLTCYCW